MVKFLPTKQKDNRGKDFSKVDASTQRGMLRTSSASSGGGEMLRVARPAQYTHLRWIVDSSLRGLVDSQGNTLVVRV